jgi:ribonucleoside-diphosphate reductase alpha chain
VLCDKLSHTRFEPSGWTGSEELGYAKSIMDYLFRWIELRFLSGKQFALFAKATTSENGARDSNLTHCGTVVAAHEVGDAPLCSSCGALMLRNGTCYKCFNCGGTSGCS